MSDHDATGDRFAEARADLNRVADDLDFVGRIGAIAPQRRASLRYAADVVRSMADGSMAAAIREALLAGDRQGH